MLSKLVKCTYLNGRKLKLLYTTGELMVNHTRNMSVSKWITPW